MNSCLHAFMPSCLHTFIPSYLRTFIPSYLHTFMPSWGGAAAPGPRPGPLHGIKVWRYEGIKYEGMKIWRCDGMKVWRYEGMLIWCVSRFNLSILESGKDEIWKSWKVEDEEWPDINFPLIRFTKAWIWISIRSKTWNENVVKRTNFSIFKWGNPQQSPPVTSCHPWAFPDGLAWPFNRR